MPSTCTAPHDVSLASRENNTVLPNQVITDIHCLSWSLIGYRTDILSFSAATSLVHISLVVSAYRDRIRLILPSVFWVKFSSFRILWLYRVLISYILVTWATQLVILSGQSMKPTRNKASQKSSCRCWWSWQTLDWIHSRRNWSACFLTKIVSELYITSDSFHGVRSATARSNIPGKRALRFERSVRIDAGAAVSVIRLFIASVYKEYRAHLVLAKLWMFFSALQRLE